MPYTLRRAVGWDEEHQCEFALVTNHMEFAANTIGAIYHERWKVELFFKARKQNLKVKIFLGTSRNALEVQFWTTLIAMLLVTFLRWLSRRGWSVSDLLALLRWNLFQDKDLLRWLDDLFERRTPAWWRWRGKAKARRHRATSTLSAPGPRV